MALNGADGAIHVGYRLVLSGLANQHLAVLGESHDGRGGTGSLGVGDDLCLAAFQNRDHRVGGSQVNTYCTSHSGVHPVVLILRRIVVVSHRAFSVNDSTHALQYPEFFSLVKSS